jgi:DNA ligase (NAD+)
VELGFARSAGQDWKAKTLIGPVSAKAILIWAASDYGRETLRRLQELGINPTGKLSSIRPNAAVRTDGLVGKVFVLTGTLPTLSRDEAASFIREAGGRVTGSVSAKTDYLLSGEDAGSKLAKAEELGVAIISESQLFELLGRKALSEPAPHQDALF